MKKNLDLGCGTGYRTFRISQNKSVQVIGVDLSEENIKVAKKRYPLVEFKCMNAEKLSFRNSFFDEIYAVDVLEHVKNLSKVLQEISRVLKTNGKLKIVVPGEKSEEWLLSLRPTYFKEINHVRIFKRHQLPKLLKKYGFVFLLDQPQNFIQHVELYYFFKTQKTSSSQLEVGSWRSNPISMAIHALVASFDSYWVFQTPLKYIPTWIITLPLGYIINSIGNRFMPKSIYYEFIKT